MDATQCETQLNTKKMFKTGDRIDHKKSKTITESDNNFFCLMTMNSHRLHLDKEYAKTTRFKERVVVGTYVFSLVVGLTVDDISWKAVANLEYGTIKHLEPVFIGDTIRAMTRVVDVKGRVVGVLTVAYNQHNNRVLSFTRKILL